MSVLDDLRARLAERREELRQEIEERLPLVERLQGEIASWREDVARLERRRDALAAWGTKPVEVPQPDAVVPLGGGHCTFEVQPLLSKLTGKQLAAEVQKEIDSLAALVKANEREVGRLLRDRS